MLSCASGSRRASNWNELCSMDRRTKGFAKGHRSLTVAFLLKPVRNTMTKQLKLLTPIATLYTEVQASCIQDPVDVLHPFFETTAGPSSAQGFAGNRMGVQGPNPDRCGVPNEHVHCYENLIMTNSPGRAES